jgi:hypothetical protein
MTLLPPSSDTVTPINVVGVCASGGFPNLRLDNLTVTGWGNHNIASDQAFAVVANMFGVADHNDVSDTMGIGNYTDFINVAHPSWLGVGSYGDNSWASPDTFGTAQAFYIENNTFNDTVVTDTDTNAGGGGGARWVCRFNTMNGINPIGASCGDHGTDTTGRARGGRQIEFYGNVGTCIDSTQGCNNFGGGSRSAVSILWGNSMTNSGGGYGKYLLGIDTQRTWRTDSPWSGCNGTSPWDTNDGGSTPTTYYTGTIGSVSGVGSGTWTITDSGSPGWTSNQWTPAGVPYAFYDTTQSYGIMVQSNNANSLTLVYLCDSCISFVPHAGDTYKIYRSTVCLDQPTRGAGLLVQGSTPVLQSTGSAGPVNEALDPDYEVDDVMPSGSSYPPMAAVEGNLIANRDFYIEATNQAAQTSSTSPFNGTSGTGHGTMANRPTSCTTGVGYWATDQGTWNTSGSGPQGELFVCTSTNNWTLYYTPYCYPHPLIAGGTSIGGTSGTGASGLGAPTCLTATFQ